MLQIGDLTGRLRSWTADCGRQCDVRVLCGNGEADCAPLFRRGGFATALKPPKMSAHRVAVTESKSMMFMCLAAVSVRALGRMGVESVGRCRKTEGRAQHPPSATLPPLLGGLSVTFLPPRRRRGGVQRAQTVDLAGP